jgi:rhamnosyltransferase
MQQIPVRIAVLICTHNGETHLDAQLASIAQQSASPVAVFVHDWGSTDSTLSLARRFAASNSNRFAVEVHAHDHAPGSKDSFLHAIRCCMSSDVAFDHLMLCDQDDIWSRDKLAVYAQRLERGDQPPDLLFSDVRIVADDGKVLAPSYYAGATSFAQPQPLDDPGILITNPVIGMTLCVSRRCLKSVESSLQGPWLMHDWAIVLLALGRGCAAEYIPLPLVDYRQHERNVLGASTGLRFFARIAKARQHFARIREQLELIAKSDTSAWPPLVLRLLRRGPLQRIYAARVVFQSRLLGRGSRWLLSSGILLLW